VNRKQVKPGNGNGSRASRHVVEYVENRRAGEGSLSPKERDFLVRTRSTKQPSARNSSAKWAQDKDSEAIAMQIVARHKRQESLQRVSRPEMKIGFAISGDEQTDKGGRTMSF
jgi:hypothetical protein